MEITTVMYNISVSVRIHPVEKAEGYTDTA